MLGKGSENGVQALRDVVLVKTDLANIRADRLQELACMPRVLSHDKLT
jgi:hypothetical protein